MGDHSIGYSKPFQNLILEKYQGKNEIIFQETLWNNVIKEKEQFLFKSISSNLAYDDIRNFMIYSIGDVIAYQNTNSQDDSYHRINADIYNNYLELRNKLSDNDIIIFVAHSLGGVILNNFIYDHQDKNPVKFSCLFTLGTPLALFSLKYKSLDLPIKLSDDQKWLNLYDKDDVLAYPITELSDKYIEHNTNGKIFDIEVNVGNILQSWNPLSHTAYWKDSDVIHYILREIP